MVANFGKEKIKLTPAEKILEDLLKVYYCEEGKGEASQLPYAGTLPDSEIKILWEKAYRAIKKIKK